MNVLLALDATPTSEAAAAAISTWARESGAAVVLVSVLHPSDIHETMSPTRFTHAATPAGTASGQALSVREPFAQPAESRTQALARARTEREDYLQGVARRWFRDACVLVDVVDCEDTAANIVKHAESLGADFIAMGTRARHGLGQALFGSVHEEVVRRATVPVLLIGPSAAPPTAP